MLWNERFDYLAFNYLADVIYESPLPLGRNLARRDFMNPARLGFYDKRVLRSGVCLLRVRSAKHTGEPRFESLSITLLESSTTSRYSGVSNRRHHLSPCRLTLHTRGSGLLDYAQSGHYNPALPESTLALFRLMTRQQKTYVAISLLSVRRRRV